MRTGRRSENCLSGLTACPYADPVDFVHERVPARRVLNLAGEQGDVPASIREHYVRTVIECYLGNGYGVSNAALPYYQQMVTRFS